MQNILQKIFKILDLWDSRTAWSIIGLVIFNGLDSVKDIIPVAYQPIVSLILGSLAIYYKANPSRIRV